MVEKLTCAVTVKFSPDSLESLHALAARRDMEVSEYIRSLVQMDMEQARHEWLALSRIFGDCHEADKENEG